MSAKTVLRTLVTLVLSLGCSTPPEGEVQTMEEQQLQSSFDFQRVGNDVAIGLSACNLVAGKATPPDVIALFGRPLASGSGSRQVWPNTRAGLLAS